ncbi:MAG: hypothetical protein AAF330_02125 [Pseudomonadota bacterium]
MKELGCPDSGTISDSSDVNVYLGTSPEGAIKTAKDNAFELAKSRANRIARENYKCTDPECRVLYVEDPVIEYTSVTTSWARPWTLIGSFLYWQWHYGAHVSYKWTAVVRCGPTPRMGPQV